jgi:inorganic pyrophosphatase
LHVSEEKILTLTKENTTFRKTIEDGAILREKLKQEIDKLNHEYKTLKAQMEAKIKGLL